MTLMPELFSGSDQINVKELIPILRRITGRGASAARLETAVLLESISRLSGRCSECGEKLVLETRIECDLGKFSKYVCKSCGD